MEPLQSWMLFAFVTLIAAGLLLLELGLRRTRRGQVKRHPAVQSHRAS